MNFLFKENKKAPCLILAPMEGVGDAAFRKAIATIGGFDFAIRDFLRVPKNAHVKSLATPYDPEELGQIPLIPQIMGSDLYLMGKMAQELVLKGAKQIDINCGCPSNTVNGRGAGSSLLKDPCYLNKVVKSVVDTVSVPVSVKMRSGFEDTSLFDENMLAAQQAGACFVTLHPRTKKEGYSPPANWKLIAKAKEILKIPVVGNGDVLTVEDALRLSHETGCDAIMIGRGAIINPFIFHQIRAHFFKIPFIKKFEDLTCYLKTYYNLIPSEKNRLRVNKLKQLFGFLFKGSSFLLEKRQEMLRVKSENPEAFFMHSLDILEKSFTK